MVKHCNILICHKIYDFRLIEKNSMSKRFPFDRKGFPISYSIASCMELTFLYYCIKNAGFCITFLYGSRSMMIAFIKNIQLDLQLLNESIKTDKNHANTQIKLKEIIRFHSYIKELSEQNNEHCNRFGEFSY